MGSLGQAGAVSNVIIRPGVVAHAFNPSTREAEAGGFLSSSPAWTAK
jgi:major histocompatibility complex class I